jgi:hypothetical protein
MQIMATNHLSDGADMASIHTICQHSDKFIPTPCWRFPHTMMRYTLTALVKLKSDTCACRCNSWRRITCRTGRIWPLSHCRAPRWPAEVDTVCCLLFVIRCLLFAVCCLMTVVCCLLSTDLCSLLVGTIGIVACFAVHTHPLFTLQASDSASGFRLPSNKMARRSCRYSLFIISVLTFLPVHCICSGKTNSNVHATAATIAHNSIISQSSIASYHHNTPM